MLPLDVHELINEKIPLAPYKMFCFLLFMTICWFRARNMNILVFWFPFFSYCCLLKDNDDRRDVSEKRTLPAGRSRFRNVSP